MRSKGTFPCWGGSESHWRETWFDTNSKKEWCASKTHPKKKAFRLKKHSMNRSLFERACLRPDPPNTTGRSVKYHGKWRTVRQIPRGVDIFSDNEKIGELTLPLTRDVKSKGSYVSRRKAATKLLRKLLQRLLLRKRRSIQLMNA